ncbi:Fc receptor-like protein 2 [Petaurus breviceps papuanus]|uniref:Fc receptor-like protein 2 n=1 Tax=Petaurus breviceps papuanus TaxID=3040969 RepID=UPI0036D93B64
MLLWTPLLILVSVNGQEPAAKKAVVIPNPSWTPVFKGEKVTLTCSGLHLLNPEELWWFYGNEWHFMSNPLEVQKAGEYRCYTIGLSESEPVYLVFSTDALILQTPYSVFEGDTLFLRCRGWNNLKFTDISYYKDKNLFSDVNENSVLSILHANSDHNGLYHCEAKWKKRYKITSKETKLQVQELFAPPELKSTTSEPTEGTPVTLSCETQLTPQRSDTKLHFSFFRNGRNITSGWKESQVFQIPAIWREDSGSYCCEAKAMTRNIQKQSNHVTINVKRIPISGILMETQPPGTQVIEGEKLVLICSVAEGTGNITFRWYKNVIRDCLREKIQNSLKEEFVFSTINKSDEGSYQRAAYNNISTMFSRIVIVTVLIPVSRPLLIFRGARMQAVMGEVLELRCEVLEGSAPILYQFYHKGLVLKTILAPFGGAVSFNLSVTTEHSGNYSCEANNSFSNQLSEMLELSVLDPAERHLLIMGITVSLLSILGIATVTVLVYFKLKSKSGISCVSVSHRDRPMTDPQESEHSKSIPPVELQPIYDNVIPFIEDVVYSEICDMKQGKIDTADNSETLPEDKDSSVTYSEVKTYSPRDSIGKDRAMDSNHEDDTENYENVMFS